MNDSEKSWQTRANRVMQAGNETEVREGYDAWAKEYDADHENFGLLLLAHFVGMFCRHVKPDSAPILDAGAGTGRLGAALSLHGYDNFVGIDLSPGMLEIAASKPAYHKTLVQRLGDTLDFEDSSFPVVASLGAFAPNLARAEAFDELIRITQPGGILVLSMRAGLESETGFDHRRHEIESEGRWHYLDGISNFISHPEIDKSLRYSIHVYQKS
ncbi:MAG: class I SAM-dependent methyltransferase [Pseudomonadota bacterium]